MRESFEEIAMDISHDDLDYGRLIGKHKEELAAKVGELSDIKAAEQCAEKMEALRVEVTEAVRAEFTLEEGNRLLESSPFLSETVEIDGYVFDGASFIYHKGTSKNPLKCV